jgi:predicted ArsR family transcriptional regulator
VKTDGEERTRQRVARLLLEAGSATAAELATRLELSSAAIRRHLDAMLADGTIIEAEVELGPRGRGRPARAFRLTESGRASFGHSYDKLASAALRVLVSHGGAEGVQAFVDARVDELEGRYRDRVLAAAPDQRATVLAQALTEDGYAASADGGQVCQHHCPVQHVAAEFPQLCEAETEAFSRLIGTPVRRLTTIAHGGSCCTTSLTDTTSHDDQPAEGKAL